MQQVARSVGTDSRVGPKFLNASVGFGGSCFQKDILNLVYICQSLGLDVVANYWEQARLLSSLQRSLFLLGGLSVAGPPCAPSCAAPLPRRRPQLCCSACTPPSTRALSTRTQCPQRWKRP